jgi:NAD(P)H-flavin reductase
MSNKNPYRSVEAEVLDVITESPAIKTIRVKTKEPIEWQTGQFIQFAVQGVGEAPFTPSSQQWLKDILEVSVMEVGKVTKKIHQLKKRDTVGIRGPFGKGYPIDKFKDREILVIGGGCGLAPLRSLMYVLLKRSGEFKKIVFRGGCKTPEDIIYKDELMDNWAKRKDLNLKLTVDVADQAWRGRVGLITAALDDVELDCKSAVAVVCGPPIAMKFTTLKLVDMGFRDENIYLSMEKNMSCGIGKCGHCRIGIYYACKDGPVFTYDKIKNFPGIWD